MLVEVSVQQRNDDEIFAALSDANRRAILDLIGEHGEMPSGDIASHFEDVTRSGISAHLRILRLAGLVSERRDGRYRLYSITSSPADAVVGYLASVYRNSLHQLTAAMDEATAREADERSA